MRINKSITTTTEQYTANALAVQTLFRFPDQVHKTSTQLASQLGTIWAKYDDQLAAAGVPAPVRAAMRTVVQHATVTIQEEDKKK